MSIDFDGDDDFCDIPDERTDQENEIKISKYNSVYCGNSETSPYYNHLTKSYVKASEINLIKNKF